MAAEDQNIGRLVAARYRLDELLGRGGFGSVYKGWDTQIGRDVAVKLLDVANRARSSQQTAELRERFRREAMAAGRINHRGVVTIYDFGIPEDDGEAFLVMELLEGHDLAAELSENGPMLPDRVQKLFIPMLEALGRGHDLGIVHKDIKPQNIFLSHPGTNSEAFVLVDFGVARVVHEDKLTMTGLIVGTPQYMAPEYITDTLVTPALDVYQMALILVEVITGSPAVPRGESFVKSCNRHFTGELDIPEQLLEGEFGHMLQLALRPIPKERIVDATRFAEMFAKIDPSTIVIDSQSTMVFSREMAPTLDEPSLFQPMNPEQVSAELDRLERGPDTSPNAPATPGAVAQPTRGAELIAVAPHQTTEPSPPPQQTQPRPAAKSSASLLLVLGVLVLFVTGGAAVVIGLTAAATDTAVAPIPPDTVPDKVTVPPTIEMQALTMTTISSEPSGAQIILAGQTIGRTPGSVEIGRADAVELHLDGYEVALVKLEADIETIKLVKRAPKVNTPSETTAAVSHPAVIRKKAQKFEGVAFEPEEPDEPDEPAEPEVAKETTSPKKYERQPAQPVKKWKSEEVPVAP